MRTEVIDPMDTAEFHAEHAINNLVDAAREIDIMRRSNEARRVLQSGQSMSDLELTRDRLSRILDDLRGL